MTRLTNLGSFKPLRELDEWDLITNQIINHGATHSLEHLLATGVTERNVRQMLTDLRTGLATIEATARRKGVELSIKHESGERDVG